MAGVDLVTLKELMGDSSISMTMSSVHPTPEHKRAAFAKLEQFNVGQVLQAYERQQGDSHQSSLSYRLCTWGESC